MVKRVGKYEIGKTLGEGTFGKVKYAVNTETGEKVRRLTLRVAWLKPWVPIGFSPVVERRVGALWGLHFCSTRS